MSRSVGVCKVCGGPTSRRERTRCKTCYLIQGGTRRTHCLQCKKMLSDRNTSGLCITCNRLRNLNKAKYNARVRTGLESRTATKPKGCVHHWLIPAVVSNDKGDYRIRCRKCNKAKTINPWAA